MSNDTNAARVAALRNAERLLRETAQEYMEGISINGQPDWEHEPDTEAAYKEHIAAADALAALAAAPKQPVDERIAVLSAPSRQQIEASDLRPVIQWLENGCDPMEAVKELRLISERATLSAPQAAQAVPKVWRLVPDAPTIKPGDRVAQALVLPVPRVVFEEVAALSETERGAGGFGSTGA